MGGRIKRLAGLLEAEARQQGQPKETICALCHRPLGSRVEQHHVIPKSQGGTHTVPVHPICHQTIHAFVANRELATSYATMDHLRERDDVGQYLRWITNKPSDFRAPTRRAKSF